MKTTNLLRVSVLIAIFAFTTNFAYSTGDAMAEAKDNLHEKIAQVFKEDISKNGNYLYNNKVYKLNDKASVTFKVNENHGIEVLEVESKSYEASQYVKYLLAEKKLTADTLLAGKAFTIDIRLRFKAK